MLLDELPNILTLRDFDFVHVRQLTALVPVTSGTLGVYAGGQVATYHPNLHNVTLHWMLAALQFSPCYQT